MSSRVKQWFDEALAISDEVERSQAMCDLAFDAECFAKEGSTVEAIELFLLLDTLDPYDDLLHPAVESARKHLVKLGLRTLTSLESLVAMYVKKYDELDERGRLLAVATALVREHADEQPRAWTIAKNLLDQAAALRPLNKKEQRLQAMVVRQAKADESGRCS